MGGVYFIEISKKTLLPYSILLSFITPPQDLTALTGLLLLFAVIFDGVGEKQRHVMHRA